MEFDIVNPSSIRQSRRLSDSAARQKRRERWQDKMEAGQRGTGGMKRPWRGIYYGQMSREEQEAYRGMFAGFCEIASEISVRRLDNRQLSDVFFRLRLDHPEIFYVESFQYRFTEDSQYVRMKPSYMFEKKKIKEHQKALEAESTLNAAGPGEDEGGGRAVYP